MFARVNENEICSADSFARMESDCVTLSLVLFLNKKHLVNQTV